MLSYIWVNMVGRYDTNIKQSFRTLKQKLFSINVKNEHKLCIYKIWEENFNQVCTFAQLCANVLTCAFKITLSAVEVGLSGSG